MGGNLRSWESGAHRTAFRQLSHWKMSFASDFGLLVFQAAKLAKMKIPPGEMFLSEVNKYSKFDENVSQPLALETLVAHIIQAGVQGLSAFGQWVSSLE